MLRYASFHMACTVQVALRLAASANDYDAALQAIVEGGDPDSCVMRDINQEESDIHQIIAHAVGPPRYEATNALNNAARNKALRIVELLVGLQCDLNVTDAANYTPLDQCARHGSIDEARVLLRSGADPRCGTKLYTKQIAFEHGNHDVYPQAILYLHD